MAGNRLLFGRPSLQWGCQCALYGPAASVDPFANVVLWDADNISPLGDAASFTAEGKEVVSSRVSGLGLAGVPDAVPGGVGSVIVLTLNGVFLGRSGAYVVAEIFKPKPPLADTDATPTVPWVGPAACFGTPSDDALPYGVDVGAVAAVDGAGSTYPLIAAVAAPAAFFDPLPRSSNDPPALALAGPEVATVVVAGVGDDGDSEKRLPREVLEAGVGGHSNRLNHDLYLDYGLWLGLGDVTASPSSVFYTRAVATGEGY